MKVIDNLKIDEIETILDPSHSGEISIMAADFKTHINVYLKELENCPVRSLADIIVFNENNAELVCYLHFWFSISWFLYALIWYDLTLC